MPAYGQTFKRASLPELAVESETLLPAVDFCAPRCIVYSNFHDLDPETGSRMMNRVYIKANYRLDAVELGRLPIGTDLIVVGWEDFVPTFMNRFLGDQVLQSWSDDAVQKALGRSRPRFDVEGPAVLVARYGFRTWGHWLGELLPKIVCVETLFPRKYRYVLPAAIFTDPVLRTEFESLEYYGINSERVIQVQHQSIYRFSELYAVSPLWTRATHHPKMHPGAIDMMRARVPADVGTGWRRVAFLRSDMATRNVANAPDVIRELKQRGFEMLEPGALPFASQVETFASAEAVVSVLGSGIFGVLYSPSGVRLMILGSTRWVAATMSYSLIQNRNARLVDIRGHQVSADSRPPALANFVVDPVEVGRGLDALYAATVDEVNESGSPAGQRLAADHGSSVRADPAIGC
jgi:hypothetical protein